MFAFLAPGACGESRLFCSLGSIEKPLSLTGKRWVITPAHDRPQHVDGTALIAWLRAHRGLEDVSAHATGSWHDATLFPDTDKAAARVRHAVSAGERIGIFGDYDCDGITSTAQMVRFLRRRGIEPSVRLPHRVHDGYGLKASHVEEFHAAGVTLLITVDTGVSAHGAVERANALGIDVIILDHHHLLTPPPAHAILHPALAPDFPEPHPSAAGVTFMFLHALEEGFWADRDTDLALAMFGTVADLVHLTGFNRSLVSEGLEVLPGLPEGPVKTLLNQVSGGKPLTSVDVAFRVAPRINAAGRMADPMLALKALLDGGAPLHDLDTLNTLRQDQTSRALERALLELGSGDERTLPSFLSIASASYPHGILGLLAGKLTDRYGRPSMAVHIAADHCTASLRSPIAFNIVQALERNKHLLISFGGHAQAAGATFALEHYEALTDAIERDAAANLPPHELTPALAIDAEVPATAITRDFCAALSTLGPFGQGNPEPVFLLREVRLLNARRVGADGRHLQAQLGGCKLIGFGLGSHVDDTTRPLDIACRVGLDSWNGRVTPQLFLVDLRHAAVQTSPSGALEKMPVR